MDLQVRLLKYRRIIIIFIAGLLGIVSFIACYGIDVLNFTNDTWLLASERDLRAHYIGWEFFRQSDWHFPIGMMDGIIYPRLISIIYTDSIPLFAIIFKIFSAFLPSTFQYFGLWGLLCFVLQGVCAAYIITRYNQNIIFNLIAVEFFILSPTLMQRLYYHTELSAHFLILLAFIIWLNRDRFDKWYKKCIAWSILLALAASIHIYFIPMIVIIMTSGLIYDAINKHQILTPIISWIIPVIVAFIVLILLGAFATQRDLGSEGGLGTFGANLNTLFNSQEWSGIVPALPVATNGQYEGYSYLGLGIFILLFICLIKLIFSRKKLKQNFNFAWLISILFCIIATLLCAWGPVITLGDQVLFEIPYPSFVISILDMFRANGRFMWIIVYMILIFIFIFIARWIGEMKKTHIILLTIGLPILLALQIVDLYPILSLRYGVGSEKKYESEDYNSLQSPIWEKMAPNYEHIEMMEEEMLVHSNYKDSFSLAQYAVTHGMTISNFAAARPTIETRKKILEENYYLLENGEADEKTLYIFGNAFDILGKELDLNMYLIDGIVVGTKDKIEGISQADDIMKYDNSAYEADFSDNLFMIPEDVENRDGKIINSGEKSEYILYGPYLSISDGVYNIKFDINVLQGDGMIGYADIVSNEGADVHAYTEIYADQTEIQFENVCLDNIDNLEIRVYINQGAKVEVNRIECKLISKDLLKYNKNFKDGKMIYSLMDDNFLVSDFSKKDKNNKVIINAGGQECDLVYGPYMLVPSGKYALTWTYDVKQANGESIGYIDVCSGMGENIIKKAEVTRNDNGSLTMPFELDKSVFDLELRFHVYDNNIVELQDVSLEAIN